MTTQNHKKVEQDAQDMSLNGLALTSQPGCRPSILVLGQLRRVSLEARCDQGLLKDIDHLMKAVAEGQVDCSPFGAIPTSAEEFDHVLDSARRHVDSGVVDLVVVGEPRDVPAPADVVLSLVLACVDRGVRVVVPAEGIDTGHEEHTNWPAPLPVSRPRPLIGAVYARDAQEYPAGLQVDLCQRHAKHGRIIVPEATIFTDGATGGRGLSRPGLSALRDALAVGLVDVVLVQALCRISRHPGELRRLIGDEIVGRGRRLISVDDAFDTDVDDWRYVLSDSDDEPPAHST